MNEMLSCPLCCQSQFSSVDLLRTTLINAIHRPFVCPICNEMQHGLDNLAAHLSKHIQVPSEINYIQPIVNDVNNVIQTTANTSNESIYNELQPFSFVDNENDGVGQVTEKVISSSPGLDQESILRESVNEIETGQQTVQVFFCHLCACSFRSLELQQMHMQLVHEMNQVETTETRNIQPSSDKVNSNLLQCDLCSKRFKMIGSLRLHVRMVHGISHAQPKIRSPRNNSAKSSSVNSCTNASAGDSMIEPSLVVDGLNQATSPNYLNYGVFAKDDSQTADSINTTNGSHNNKETNAQNSDDRIHECDICNKRFTTKYFLKKHKRIHTGETPYTCELCNRTFTFQQSYHRHLSYHTNDRPHICSICGRAFKESSTLYNHQRIHSGEKPFECESCGKCFRQRVSYLVHRRIHTGVMPYNCVTCDRKFRYKISLRTHKCTGKKETEQTDMTFVTTDQETQPCSEQTLDEFITESCNRLGIVDHNESNHGAVYTCENTENGIQSTAYDCDSFNLNDLPFCDGETIHTDLANVTPSMSEIFPQTMDILNALYDNDNRHFL